MSPLNSFFLTVPLETNYLRTYWTDLREISQWIGYTLVGMINPTFFSRSLKGRCYGNRYLALIGENWHAPLSFCALAVHDGWENCNKDVRVNTADDPSTSVKNLVNFGPIISEFCRRVCAGRATRCALPRILVVVVCGVQTA